MNRDTKRLSLVLDVTIPMADGQPHLVAINLLLQGDPAFPVDPALAQHLSHLLALGLMQDLRVIHKEV